MVTTHVLDTSRGRPAAGVEVRLEGSDKLLAAAITDQDGRVSRLGPDVLPTGTYRLVFDTGGYFEAAGDETFYPQVTVDFEITDRGAHYHLPVLVSPYGFTTYRGS